ncbi:hypothetical protein L249_1169 [Ophiocordyceps polyrhachis-furcata BCC 54312]|uniref:Uncharacterized protein n=1 Tax=Ophiocordyceps polyrhachis-furcata BCC 54312 TaxID=1330021 RepID=A0A367LDH5_9HYPO|nr:hypothetical protein L249_1169 [Ophiocordyceps polyrhachis-furcata BCC 54312]
MWLTGSTMHCHQTPSRRFQCDEDQRFPQRETSPESRPYLTENRSSPTYPLSSYTKQNKTVLNSKEATMKNVSAQLLLLLLPSLASFTAGSPPSSTKIEARDNCFHPSSCSASWAGKCEDYCGSRGFSHMTGDGCGWFQKKCCCIRK